MSSVDQLIRAMEGARASDIFFCDGRKPSARIDGRVAVVDWPVTTADELVLLLDQIKGARGRFEATGDIDVGYTLDDRRYRINVARAQERITMVVRALPTADLSFATLGLPEAAKTFAEIPRGLVLVTGATGSGKSTTLAAMINHINSTRQAHIVTIEDPIEFLHKDRMAHVTQREVGSDTDTFQTALRQVVRQSPDVILIGELRDADTMTAALNAALTGHLVLASLHTVDATQTLQRILWYFPEHLRNQAALDLSIALKGIISQRLIPRKDGTGRALATEVLSNTPATARLLRDQRTDDLTDLMRSDPGAGMGTFNESLMRLFRTGAISYETGFAYASNPEEFALWAKGMSTGVDAFRNERGAGVAHNLDMKTLLRVTLEQGASDLHLAVGRPPIVRVSGSLRPLTKTPLSDVDLRTLLFSIMSSRQRQTYELEREIDFALQMEDQRRFRVNAYYQTGRLACALRAIAKDIPDPEALRLPDVVMKMAEKPQGLLLVVGPTGAGKSTTLACLVNRINATRPCRILTVEDPIEYVHTSKKATVDQREVGADTKSFAAALKYVLRQDPDVILVGEMRDTETISAALTAAETGHLVLATLHTNDAMQAIDRIIDVFPPFQQPQVRSQLASSLNGVVSQRLLTRKDNQGRIAAFEVMPGTGAIRSLIRDNKMHQAISIMEAGRREGCQTLDMSVNELMHHGLIDVEEGGRYLRQQRVPRTV